MCNNEIFVPIESTGFEISSYGRVKCPDGTIKDFSNCPKSVYYQVHLGKSYTKSKYGVAVHRLVAEAFIPNPENKPEINHKDGNKHNNRVDNLEWCTQSENVKHAWETGLFDRQHHIDVHKGKRLSEDHKRKIGQAQKGRVKSLEERKHISEGQRGRKFSEEHKRKLSEAHRGKTLSDECKQKLSIAHRKYYESPEARAKTGLVAKGKIWVTDGVTNKRILPDQIEDFLQIGFRRGKIHSRK